MLKAIKVVSQSSYNSVSTIVFISTIPSSITDSRNLSHSHNYFETTSEKKKKDLSYYHFTYSTMVSPNALLGVTAYVALPIVSGKPSTRSQSS